MSRADLAGARGLVRRRLLVATAAAGGLAVAPSLRAQAFPSRPVRMILGFPPGGSGDFIGRTLAEEASRSLGQQVIVENRPGAGGNLASEFVARAPADGLTLLLGGSFSHSVNPALFPRLPFDTQKDFAPITKVAVLPTVFAVPASLPVDTLQDFIAWARREGDRVSYGSSGIGSPGHIAGAYFNAVTGLKMTHVPYKGAGDTVRDLLAGQLQLVITSPTSIMGFVKQGRAKALALTTPGRSRVVPGVPGSDEAGLKDFDIDGWYGLWTTGGSPPAAVAALHAAFSQALKAPAIIEKLEAQGATPEPSPSTEQFAGFVRENARQWKDIVVRSGATVQ
ncbi:MAG: tripartite tricarboxylate transporter substrate binding protein [Burkholderiales bacterium]|jgi:tripartite-type tricarboxylate transporter receptor subunit TctC